MTELVNGVVDNKIDEGLTAKFSFSQKPPRGHYEDYYEKMTTYAAMLAGHAEVLQPGVTARVYRVVEPEEDDDSPFNYLDTASSRAEINNVTRKLRLDRVAIIGLGGTGSYVLDLVAKTPVREIHFTTPTCTRPITLSARRRRLRSKNCASSRRKCRTSR